MPNYDFVLNGEPVSVDVTEDVELLYVLRDKLGVTGPKFGCGVDVCKACTSHLNGRAIRPCVTSMSEVEGQEVTTIEGLADTVDSDLHPVQEEWINRDVAQCGFCQPGQIMEAVDLIARTGGKPSDEDIDAIENMCRCGTYFRIREAIKAAAARM